MMMIFPNTIRYFNYLSPKHEAYLFRAHYMTLTKKPCEGTMSYYISNLGREVVPLLF